MKRAKSEKVKIPFESAWERISEITGWKRYGALASFLKIEPGSVSGAKKRGFMPIEWLFEVGQAFGTSTDWLAVGDGLIFDKSQSAVGNGFVQGHSIDAEEIHIDVHNHVSKEPGEGYTAPIDPLDARFLTDWHSLSDVGMMRVWTLLKEEIQREKEGGQ